LIDPAGNEPARRAEYRQLRSLCTKPAEMLDRPCIEISRGDDEGMTDDASIRSNQFMAALQAQFGPKEPQQLPIGRPSYKYLSKPEFSQA
jgi:hypothetical protein